MIKVVLCRGEMRSKTDGCIYKFALKREGYAIEGCTGDGGDIVLPDSFEGVPVASISAEAFKWCKTITSVTIPNSITYIGDEAFLRCISLVSVVIPDSVTIINKRVFAECPLLESINIPDSIKKIDNRAFEGCTRLPAIIPARTEFIGGMAFDRCKMIVTAPHSPKYYSYKPDYGIKWRIRKWFIKK